MTYFNAIKFIKNAPNIAPKDTSAPDRVAMLFKALQNPQKRMKYMRITGSNGKTVCVKMLSAILCKAEISNGCLIMPLQPEIRENILINGTPLSIEETVKYVEQIVNATAHINKAYTSEDGHSPLFVPTAHEIILCMAVLAFASHGCTLAIIESDHTADDPSRFLPAPSWAIIAGRIPIKERNEIAKIRSYICRGLNEVVSAPQTPEGYKVISDSCSIAGCRLTLARHKIDIKHITLYGTVFTYRNNEYSLRLCGKFETNNACVAIEASNMLARYGYKISLKNIQDALSSLSIPCKLEIISFCPTIIADSTHNGVAINSVCDSLSEFKEATGTKLRLFVPDSELAEKYVIALTARGYTIDTLYLFGDEENLLEANANIPQPIFCKTLKKAAKLMLSDLSRDDMLIISGPSAIALKLRYELLAILGFSFS